MSIPEGKDIVCRQELKMEDLCENGSVLLAHWSGVGHIVRICAKRRCGGKWQTVSDFAEEHTMEYKFMEEGF